MQEDARQQEFRQEVRRAREGDREALDRLLERLQSRLLKDADRRLGRRLRGKTRPSDVLQDAYLEVVRRIGEFQGESEAELYSWVTAIIESSARQQHRRLSAKKRKAPTRTSQINAVARAIIHSTHSPATEAEQAEAVELVTRALAGLREDHRVVIEQVVLRSRPVAEVAGALSRSEAATRMLLSRARAALTLAVEKLES